MVGRTVRVALVIGAVVLAGAGCTPPDEGGGGATTTTTIDEHAVAGCKTERAAITTAYAAASVARLAGSADETMFDYLSGPIAYFSLEPGPTTGPVGRTAGTLAAASEADCASIPLSQVPLGSY
jgi:hypothetical protein